MKLLKLNLINKVSLIWRGTIYIIRMHQVSRNFPYLENLKTVSKTPNPKLQNNTLAVHASLQLASENMLPFSGEVRLPVFICSNLGTKQLTNCQLSFQHILTILVSTGEMMETTDNFYCIWRRLLVL